MPSLFGQFGAHFVAVVVGISWWEILEGAHKRTSIMQCHIPEYNGIEAVKFLVVTMLAAK